MFYFEKTPGFLRLLYPGCIWEMDKMEKTIYLSFDDGPHAEITPFVLDELKKYHAKATFFCIGKNVLANPSVYQRIIAEGHRVGNHSFNHLNGWKTDDAVYLDDIAEAGKYIDSNLFRPPYGKITRFQLSQLSLPRFSLKTVMWTVLSGDFDPVITPELCLKTVTRKTGPGSIVVFHDSEKAYMRLRYALPGMLEYFSGQGYRFESIR